MNQTRPLTIEDYNRLPAAEQYALARFLHSRGAMHLKPASVDDADAARWMIAYRQNTILQFSIKKLVESKKSVDPRKRA